ncbi:hypothetical protein EJ06DRAFT_220511 [Trichodelitschia bisporula]|uniref:Uncharacterized protein n=1 Tax=Trichodelitschia bisporula TaxID=703511 RepID=A0A6G1I925_9PEZI|nr:hypothetical protein EJ06DRAFT_220511 [Trichodelitschia bisporula]
MSSPPTPPLSSLSFPPPALTHQNTAYNNHNSRYHLAPTSPAPPASSETWLSKRLPLLTPSPPPTPPSSRPQTPYFPVLSARPETPPPTQRQHSQASTASRAGPRAKSASRALWGGLFTGTSAPVAVGVGLSQAPTPAPRDEHQAYTAHSRTTSTASIASSRQSSSPRAEDEAMDPFTARPHPTQRSSHTHTLSAPKKLSSWFSRPSRPAAQTQRQEGEDPLLRPPMELLLPSGEHDPLDPSAYNDLLAQAVGVIVQLQEKNRVQEGKLRDALAEVDVRGEEVERLRRGDDGSAREQMRRTSIRVVPFESGMLPVRERRKRGSDASLGGDSGIGSEAETDEGSVGSGVEGMAERVKIVRVETGEECASGVRAENAALRARVRELEEVVDGCLGLVAGVGGR